MDILNICQAVGYAVALLVLISRIVLQADTIAALQVRVGILEGRIRHEEAERACRELDRTQPVYLETLEGYRCDN